MLRGCLHDALQGIRRPRTARFPCRMLRTERRGGGVGGQLLILATTLVRILLPIITVLQLSQGLPTLSKERKNNHLSAGAEMTALD